MRVTLANGRSQLPFSLANTAVTTGGTNSVSRTLYLSLQGENPAGLNLLSIIGPITINTGQRLTVTIPATARLAGEWWTDFVISASTSSDPESFVQLAKLPGYTVGGALAELPSAIVFDSNEDFALSSSVASPSNLPISPLNGAVRAIASLNAVFAYNLASTTAVDDLNVLPGLDSVGRWIKRLQGFSTFVDIESGFGGCAQDIASLDANGIAQAKYAANGAAGIVRRIWLINDSEVAEKAGTRVGLTVTLDEEPKSALFNNLLKVVFRGYVNTTTFAVRSTYEDSSPFPLVDQELGFQSRKSNLILPDDLLAGEAYSLDVYPSFSQSSLRRGAVNLAQIKINPFFYEEAGEYFEGGDIVGNAIAPTGSMRLVVPGVGRQVRVLSGSGVVESISFHDVGQTTVSALAADTANQVIAIDGNGNVRRGSLPLDVTEAIRAIVSTVNGTGSASNWSSALTITDNQSIAVTCYYPSDDNGNGTIRADYPDTKIAGNNKGKFNPSSVVLYVKRSSNGQIRAFSGLTVIPAVSQVFTLPNWSSGSVIAAIPTPANQTFGLFAPANAVMSVGLGASDYDADSYQISFAFEHTGVVTAISHDEALGCILTLDAGTNLATVISRSKYWAEPLDSISALRQLSPTRISFGQHRYVMGVGSFAYEPVVSSDNGTTVIRPDAVDALQIGRWLLDRPDAVKISDVGAALVVASVSAIKALNSAQCLDLPARAIASNIPVWYIFVADSTATGNDDTVLMPSTNPTAGRWLKIAGGSSGGGGGSTTIAGNVICTSGAPVAGSGKAFEFTSVGNYFISIAVASGVSLRSGGNTIIVHLWTEEPNIGQLGKIEPREISLPETGGDVGITVNSTKRWLTLGAKFAEQTFYDAPYFTVTGNTLTIVGN